MADSNLTPSIPKVKFTGLIVINPNLSLAIATVWSPDPKEGGLVTVECFLGFCKLMQHDIACFCRVVQQHVVQGQLS